MAGVGAGGLVELGLGGLDVVEHDAGDVRHHIERRADHVGVGAERERFGHGHGCRSERVDDAVLASHVVRSGEDAVQRRAAQHELAAVGVGHAGGDVRLAAHDHLGGEGRAELRQRAIGPARERHRIDAGRGAARHRPTGP